MSHCGYSKDTLSLTTVLNVSLLAQSIIFLYVCGLDTVFVHSFTIIHKITKLPSFNAYAGDVKEIQQGDEKKEGLIRPSLMNQSEKEKPKKRAYGVRFPKY